MLIKIFKEAWFKKLLVVVMAIAIVIATDKRWQEYFEDRSLNKEFPGYFEEGNKFLRLTNYTRIRNTISLVMKVRTSSSSALDYENVRRQYKRYFQNKICGHSFLLKSLKDGMHVMFELRDGDIDGEFDIFTLNVRYGDCI